MKADLTGIKNIIFDLGGVLLNLDFDASIKTFQDIGLKNEVVDYQQAYADPVFYELETGKVTPANFRERVRRILNNPHATDAEIDDAWCAVFSGIPVNRVKKIQELGKKYNLFLFSNTNHIHIKRLHAEFKAEHGIKLPSLFIESYYSHDINERKPDLSAFQKVIRLSGVKPEETLFVDDLEKNIVGAEKAGLKTFWLKKGMELSEIF
jgi:glucose-1-phosphatase